MANILVKWFLFIISMSISRGYFEDQPKLLTENGNLILESANDRNITFRLRGRGSLNVNNFNVLRLFGNRLSNTSSYDPSIRLNMIDVHLDEIQRRFTGARGITQRLNRLENRTSSIATNSNGNSGMNGRSSRNLAWRVTQLEVKVDNLIATHKADNCTSNPCTNGGKCDSLFGGYECRCMEGWTGTNCELDENECAKYAGTDLGCQNGATCTNTAGGYSCQCMPGWQGIHCTRRTVDCLTSSTELCGHGVCVHIADAIGYHCICAQGWTTNGVTQACMIDVNECASGKPHCSMDPQVDCVNVPGSFMCGPCPHGYTGNGFYCRDINECEINNGGCSVSPYILCVNTRGSYRCGMCPPGYTGDGRTCMRSLAPAESGSNPPSMLSCQSELCHPLARCVENMYGQSCLCPSGYTGNGYGPTGCVRSSFDPCARNPCLNGGFCTPNFSSFICTCPTGTIPPLCKAAQNNPCASSPCRNGGTCVSMYALRYRCNCQSTYTGSNCQTENRACGGVINSLNGTLKYPASENYPHNSRCAWLIKTNSTKVLNVTFTKFDMELSNDCIYDWLQIKPPKLCTQNIPPALQIHDGRTSASYMIGRFCGTQLPKGGNIISTSYLLYFWFRSDNSSANEGFELNFNSIDPVCGGEISVLSHGTISSPGSPGEYPINRDCTWVLTAPPAKRIQFHFYLMQLEAHENCQFDYLAIYSGLLTEGTLLEKFCNTTHPSPFTTPSNTVTLHFHSDEAATDAGFQIHYSVVEGYPGCGGLYTANKGEINSPLDDGAYPKNLLCHYVIQVPKDNHIRLTFKSFRLEINAACLFDYLEIYEGSTEAAPKASRWCGTTIPSPLVSLTNELLVLFKTDWSSNHAGFSLAYEIVCGGTFSSETGIIMSPLYPKRYEEDISCEYVIEAPIEKGILLDFMDFDIEENSYPSCDFDYVAVYDGVDRNATRTGRYCGTRTPPRQTSTFNYMLLAFQSDSSIGGRGFKANYSFVELDVQ